MVDATDGVLMVGAYGWALKQPMRKLMYNFIITAFSVLAALIIAALEVLDLIASRSAPTGPFWEWVGYLNHHSGAMGCAIIAALGACWAMFAILTRRRSMAAIRI